jgi:hypothetical protein
MFSALILSGGFRRGRVRKRMTGDLGCLEVLNLGFDRMINSHTILFLLFPEIQYQPN